MPQDNTVLMEGVQLIFKNFAGKESQYNREGDRNFAVKLDETVATQMADDGWNVKFLNPRESDEETEGGPQAYLPVSLSFKGRPPNVVLITSRGRTHLGEGDVEMLDWADIVNVDLIVNPYAWGPINGKSGIKAYLKSIYVTIDEDPLERKYADLDRSE